MDNGKDRMACAQARDMDMVGYLAGLGFQPTKIRGDDFWYRSPFRDEKTPSFKINRRINRWYDFGEGCGGNLIDFAIRYNQCTVGEFLRSLSLASAGFRPFVPGKVAKVAPESPITVLRDLSIGSHALVEYLDARRIPIAIADRYCREVRYKVGDKAYYAIGFRNDFGGYELRNPRFKGSSSPKGITTIRNGHDTVCVFEGFMDFLSFLAILGNSGIENGYDYLILNSLAFFEASREVLEQYPKRHLYLDRDTAGQNCALYARSLSAKYEDRSYLYKSHKDLNDFLCFPGNTANDFKKRLNPPKGIKPFRPR